MNAVIELRDPRCRKCPLFATCRTVCLFGHGNETSDVVFVGEAPGESEDHIGRPFVGDAGTLLNNILEEFKINRQNIYITNAVKCRPPNNAQPKVAEIRACRDYLIDEISAINPKLIVALGLVAIKSLMDDTTLKINTSRGKIFYAPFETIKHIPIVVTYHPAGVLRNQDWINPVLSDFEKITKYLKDGIPKKKKVEYFEGVCPVEKRIVFDLETTGLDPFKEGGEIKCIGTTHTSHTGFVTENLDDVKHLLENPKIVKIGHNIKFDIKWCRKHGVKIRGPVRDTMVEAHLLNENEPSFGLKELSAQYTDMGGYTDKIDRVVKLTKGDRSKVPRNILLKYCAADCDAAYRLDELFLPQIKEQGLYPIFKLTMRGLELFSRAELAGVKIDLEHREYLAKVFKKKIDTLYRKIGAASGVEDFNPDSSMQLGALLTGKFGLPIVKQTKKGKVSVDKFALEKLEKIDKSGIVKAILRLRKLNGDYSKYLEDTEKKNIISSDGYIHCEYRINGTDTGRYSCVNPNLQQVTKESPIKEIFISRFVPGRIVQIDYDQGELRLLAQYTQDSTLLESFRHGRDIHTTTASKIFGVKFDSVTPQQRFAAKTINFGILYGMGPDKLSNTLGISITKAASFIRDYYANLKDVTKWKKDREREILETGQVTSLFGRKRRIPIVDENNKKALFKAQRQAVNAPIQGALHDLNILFATSLDNFLRRHNYQSIIILSVHDSIILDCPEEEVKEVEKIAKKLASEVDTSEFGFSFNVPLTVSIGHGVNWKEASESD